MQRNGAELPRNLNTTMMKKKVMITGSSGFLGSRLALFLKDACDLLLPAHSELNICREEAVRAYLEEHRPDVVIHCAALSDTGYCEQHPEESHRVNVQGTVRVAKACKRTGARLVFMSSDQVYNGSPLSGPLKEADAIAPANVYGRHKLEAEQRALLNLPDSVGLRLTWMYDVPDCRLRQNRGLLLNLQRAHDEGTVVRAATHEFRGVTNVWEVIGNMSKAWDLPGGIYNFGCGNGMNSHELQLETARLMGLRDPSAWIRPDDERFCDRSRNLSMDCTAVGSHGIWFRDSLEGVEAALGCPFGQVAPHLPQALPRV